MGVYVSWQERNTGLGVKLVTQLVHWLLSAAVVTQLRTRHDAGPDRSVDGNAFKPG